MCHLPLDKELFFMWKKMNSLHLRMVSVNFYYNYHNVICALRLGELKTAFEYNLTNEDYIVTDVDKYKYDKGLMDHISHFSNIGSIKSEIHIFVCLFWVAQANFQQFDDRAAYLNLCLALTAFSSVYSFMCYTYCDTGPPFIRSYRKDPWFSTMNVMLLAKEQSLHIMNILDLMQLTYLQHFLDAKWGH
jgi:hypothetical protein